MAGRTKLMEICADSVSVRPIEAIKTQFGARSILCPVCSARVLPNELHVYKRIALPDFEVGPQIESHTLIHVMNGSRNPYALLRREGSLPRLQRPMVEIEDDEAAARELEPIQPEPELELEDDEMADVEGDGCEAARQPYQR